MLLIALGSDYNVFTVGEVWQEARTRPLREALIDTVPRPARVRLPRQASADPRWAPLISWLAWAATALWARTS